MSFDWAYINTALILAVFLYGIRKWNGPSQSIRLDATESDLRMAVANLRRVDRDLNEWRRESIDSLEKIWHELRTISQNGAKEHPLEDELRKIEDRLLDVEQVVASMPCQPKCKPDVQED